MVQDVTAILAALHALCPGHADLAPYLKAAERRFLVHGVALAVLVQAESGCRVNAVNRRTGAAGLTQILPTGNANPGHLDASELLDVETNINLGARHLARCMTLCGSLVGGLTVYHGKKRCRPDAHARKLMWRFEHAFESVAHQDRSAGLRSHSLRRHRKLEAALVAAVVENRPPAQEAPSEAGRSARAPWPDALVTGRVALLRGERSGAVDRRVGLRDLSCLPGRRRDCDAALPLEHTVR